MDSENILLIRDDDLPLDHKFLELLEISHKELEALLETAAKLLAKTNPDDRMRAYAVRHSSGEWRVKLLPP